jgi:hypothetical protein
MVVMARRRKRRKPSWRDPEADRAPNLGAHWRADGSPKTAYRSQNEALGAADERRQESGAELNVYQCDFCHAWHMGSRGSRAR